MIKLIATDMDGTFLRHDMTYDEDKFAAIHDQLKQQGIRWVVASGNQYYQLKSFFTKYPDTIYVAENGAYIRDLKQTYAAHTFNPAVVAQILPKLQAIPDLQLTVCGLRRAYVLTTEDPVHVADVNRYYPELAAVDSFDDIDDKVLKFAITCPVERTMEIVDQLREELVGLAVPTSSGHGDIDVIQIGTHKAAGLQELGDILGIGLNEMCAFGDGGNDLEMIREVGLGVAMQNAQPDVKAVADDQTTDNESQGVLAFMADLLVAPQ
ncbi:HAD family hydrolase [Lactobacillus pentosus] [Lactiplantibacillus mudanjiangensis]|uniref:Cof-type HAD-IIB family hydrolase n=1 Tax=Lactiplantibacillus mudanjiangensis TaxID=1296538 RepID=UPI001015318D|nr:Cof-type HAD-IIB family hydrolase [Lactiplantibacillus mudanjiangensis]VDG21388.1 HAD family hydrolase [Lactobacillus pentosus] [Lactiplantibacillus mudanjiangensis]VDG31609.1 HAD family hydrolase [Lactobacillus pentosus] [Lactiplantibacillus mudanjiangensis]